MTSIKFCDEAPTVTARSGVYMVEVMSGGERVAFAMTHKALAILAQRSVDTIIEVETARRNNLVPFETPKPARKRRA